MQELQCCFSKNNHKNGGVMENEVENDGIIYQRYWITLKRVMQMEEIKAMIYWKAHLKI